MISGSAARLGKLGSFLAPCILVIALSFAISWPLWFFATVGRRAFTIAVGAVAALVLLFLLGLALRKRLQNRSSAPGASGGRARRV
jgi:hypothetical protein